MGKHYQPPRDDSIDPVTINGMGERRLWLSVIIQVFQDLKLKDFYGAGSQQGSRKGNESRVAHNWFGTPDFYYVCSMAGVSPIAVREAYESGRWRDIKMFVPRTDSGKHKRKRKVQM